MAPVPDWIAVLAALALGAALMGLFKAWQKRSEEKAEKHREISNRAWEGHRAYEELRSVRSRLHDLETMPHNQWKPNK